MSKLMSTLSEDLQSLTLRKPVMLSGRVSRFDGSMIYCDGFPAGIGALCHVETDGGKALSQKLSGLKTAKIFYLCMRLERVSKSDRALLW